MCPALSLTVQFLPQSIIDADVNETANERVNDVDKNKQGVQVAETNEVEKASKVVKSSKGTKTNKVVKASKVV